MLSFRSFGGVCETATCPVRELTSRRVGVSASCPVTGNVVAGRLSDATEMPGQPVAGDGEAERQGEGGDAAEW